MCESGGLKPWDRSHLLRAVFELPTKQSWKKLYPAMSDFRANQIDRETVGYATFNTANASLARSLRRLGDRGLISYEQVWDTDGYLACRVSLE
jgi:hypothetical protein